MSVPTATLDAIGASNASDVAAKHCIFQCGTSHYAVSATNINEVAYLQSLVPVPRCPSVIAGISHIRSEFVPVVCINPILGIHDESEAGDSKQLLLLSHALGTWGLMIDRVIAIDSIETHVDSGHRGEGQWLPVLGTATYRSFVVRVLDPKVLHRVAQQALFHEWTSHTVASRQSAKLGALS